MRHDRFTSACTLVSRLKASLKAIQVANVCRGDRPQNILSRLQQFFKVSAESLSNEASLLYPLQRCLR